MKQWDKIVYSRLYNKITDIIVSHKSSEFDPELNRYVLDLEFGQLMYYVILEKIVKETPRINGPTEKQVVFRDSETPWYSKDELKKLHKSLLNND